jgi:hypothetical protein
VVRASEHGEVTAARCFALRFARRHVDLARVSSALCPDS